MFPKYISTYATEMNCESKRTSTDISTYFNDVGGNYDLNKFEGKPRSSSMISNREDSTDVGIIMRERVGSMFLPHLCVHCNMVEDDNCEYKNLESKVDYNFSYCEQFPKTSFDNTGSGSLLSPRSSSPSSCSGRNSVENDDNMYGLGKEFGQFLEVPNWKPRASSFDSGISHNDLRTSQSRRASFEEVLNKEKTRATSVDVHMQSDGVKSLIDDESPRIGRKKSRFSIVSISSRQTISRVIKTLQSSKFHFSPSTSKVKNINYCSQWNNNSLSKEHIWYPDNSVRQRCSIINCKLYNAADTFKCSVCKIVSCNPCKDKIKNTCRKTFYRESWNKVNAEIPKVKHHWIHRSQYKGTCKSCSKNMTSQTMFLCKKSVVALQCSWCKICYHNKKACFTENLLKEYCLFGCHKEAILHPAMIEKSTKSKFHSNEEDQHVDYPFDSYSITFPDDGCLTLTKTFKPILALINPKSGGRQGLDVINELQWILNPRQVFDISSIAPQHILNMYKEITNLQILVGGGDGTVNWILRTVESINCHENHPTVAVMPLGTGNDLARELNWGSSYNSADKISKVIEDMVNGTIISIDIWRISSCSLLWEKMSTQDSSQSQNPSKLPLDLFNNYFSVGSDAATALEFHLEREKNPSRYSSRLKNKLCYAEIGGKDLWKREYKNLADSIFLECDGISYKTRIEELRPHCILFLNITNYGAGTNPWGKHSINSEFVAQSISDGILEVIGLSAASLATLHIGGQGDRICQCKCAEIKILRETPIQIDGEPVLIQPCTINISHKHQYPFIKRECRK